MGHGKQIVMSFQDIDLAPELINEPTSPMLNKVADNNETISELFQSRNTLLIKISHIKP